jgi:hypothetical protein
MKKKELAVPFFYWYNHWGGFLLWLLTLGAFLGIMIILVLDIIDSGPAMPIIYFIFYIIAFPLLLIVNGFYLIQMWDNNPFADTATIFALFTSTTIYTAISALIVLIWTLTHSSQFTKVSFYDDEKAYIGFIGLINQLFIGINLLFVIWAIIIIISYNLRAHFFLVTGKSASTHPSSSKLGFLV